MGEAEDMLANACKSRQGRQSLTFGAGGKKEALLLFLLLSLPLCSIFAFGLAPPRRLSSLKTKTGRKEGFLFVAVGFSTSLSCNLPILLPG